MEFRIVDRQHRQELVHDSRRGIEVPMLLLLLNSRNGSLSPWLSAFCGLFGTVKLTDLEQASMALANAAVADDIARSALRYAFAADINC